MYASSENKHFFTKSCHREIYKNYEEPPRISKNVSNLSEKKISMKNI